MVEINLTLFIQAINFIIAYFILRMFFFRPVIAAIRQEDHEKESLIDTIEQRRIMLEDREKERQMQWRTCQDYFVQHAPVLLSQPIPIKKSSIKLITPSLDSKEIEEYSTVIANDIVQKVRHVR